MDDTHNSSDNDTQQQNSPRPEKDLDFEPLLLQNIDLDDRHRISVILDEFIRGFRFIQQYPGSVTFFGSARTQPDTPDYNKAREVASRIAKDLDYSIVTGGGPGIMEAANRGACDVDGKSLGLTIKLPNEQATNQYVREYVEFYYFFVRKVMLSFSAETYIFFPGGFGTMDELFEILTLIQTGKIKRVPVIVVDNGHWEDFDSYIKENLLEKNMIDKEDVDIYTVTDDIDRILEIISSTPVQKGVPGSNTN